MLGFLALIAVAATDRDVFIDGPPDDWLVANAKYGWDITLDGKVWVNTNAIGKTNDYAILGNDLYRVRTAANTKPRVWIRGYHLRNPKVAYRESKILVSFDCVRDTYFTEREVRYNAAGDVLATLGPYSIEPIIPGSVAERWRDTVCTND